MSEISVGKYGSPEYSVTLGKQWQLIRLASGYLYERGKFTLPCRFDVIAIEFRNGKPVINHIPNAFTYLRELGDFFKFFRTFSAGIFSFEDVYYSSHRFDYIRHE